jgi:hypothetical protein
MLRRAAIGRFHDHMTVCFLSAGKKFLHSVALGACSRKRGPSGRFSQKVYDSDYNEENFFVRQAYFLGANDPVKA